MQKVLGIVPCKFGQELGDQGLELRGGRIKFSAKRMVQRERTLIRSVEYGTLLKMFPLVGG
jgi:hypothetical protein